MQKKKEFEKWLKNNTSLSSSSITKYTGAINTISKELSKLNHLQGSLYNYSDPIEINVKIEKYFSITEFSEKDYRGNRMYSNALRYYLEFAKNAQH